MTHITHKFIKLYLNANIYIYKYLYRYIYLGIYLRFMYLVKTLTRLYNIRNCMYIQILNTYANIESNLWIMICTFFSNIIIYRYSNILILMYKNINMYILWYCILGIERVYKIHICIIYYMTIVYI